MTSSVGWLATAIITASYFCTGQKTLRMVQGFGAVVWMTYGILIGSTPVIVANIIVAVVALYSSFSLKQTPSAP